MAQTTFIRARVTPNLAEQFQLAAQLDGRTASGAVDELRAAAGKCSAMVVHLYALGEDPGTVMDELGHADESVALRIYRRPIQPGG
jgi:hypothetical protein